MIDARGATLLEMLVVLGVMGATVGLGLMLSSGQAERSADRAAARVADQLRGVRSEAMRAGQVRQVELGAPATRADRAVRVLRASAPDGRVHAASGEPIVFFPDGSARPAAVEVHQGAKVRRIDIHWTGAIDVHTRR